MTVRILIGDCRYLGRDAVLCELNPEYAAMARRRLTDDSALFAEVTT